MKIVRLVVLFVFVLNCSGASSGGVSPIFGLLGGSQAGGISTAISESASLKSIQIEPANANAIVLNTDDDSKQASVEFKAIAIYSDGNKVDVTSSVKWDTTDKSIAEYTEASPLV